MESNQIIDILTNKARSKELAHFYTVTPITEDIDCEEFVEKLLLNLVAQNTGNMSHPQNGHEFLVNNPDILFIQTTAGSYSIKNNDFSDFFDFLKSRPLVLDKKFIVIKEAHKVSEILWNKLLKSLEEPEVSVTIFLINNKKVDLLPTITSRTIKITLYPHNKDLNHSKNIYDFLESLKLGDDFTTKSFSYLVSNFNLTKLQLDLKARDFDEMTFLKLCHQYAALAANYEQSCEFIKIMENYQIFKNYNNSLYSRMGYLYLKLAALFSWHIE